MTDDSEMEFRRIDCSDPAAEQEVLAILEPGQFGDCIGVDGVLSGVAQSYPEPATLCTCQVGVDPTTAVNNITAGERLVREEGSEVPVRADCGEPEAMRVEGRVDDVLPPDHPDAPADGSTCVEAGLPQTEMMLHFGITGVIDGQPERHYRLMYMTMP
ncbi:hypothetical protein [Dietzia sp. NCCP-2495]|uniref:hypothetical protein n=1 Tax=Dietzia sp. NCCP-2495 TaxID=2934675 RepID=UPI00222EF8C5|nr:hypothetical protein [Dietzia sp. NCCP-2495]